MIEVGSTVREFLLDAGLRYERTDAGALWALSDEGLIIMKHGGLFDVSVWSRGQIYPAQLKGATQEVVEVYLVLYYGSSWRSRNRIDRVVTTDWSSPLPAGFEISNELDRTQSLMLHGQPGLYLRGMIARDATELAHALTIPLQDLIASFKHPDGLPAFPMGEPSS